MPACSFAGTQASAAFKLSMCLQQGLATVHCSLYTPTVFPLQTSHHPLCHGGLLSIQWLLHGCHACGNSTSGLTGHCPCSAALYNAAVSRQAVGK
eukprot:1142092-Pelagomonas_calceolata.AAC.3